MWDALATEIGDVEIAAALRDRQGLLSPCAILLPRHQAERVAQAVAALHAAFSQPSLIEAALEVARGDGLPDHGLGGWMLGFDFHLTPDGPRLIEINTNPGGMLAVAAQARAQAVCRPELGDAPEVEATALDAFHDEWRRQRGDRPLTSVAIIDDDPASQYLDPEFRLYRCLFERNGLRAEIIDPGQFSPDRVDMVYNRLVDFALDSPGHAALARAWREGKTVVTPDPRAHYLFSDKRVMALLSDEPALRALGLRTDIAATVARTVPPTVPVRADNADDLWNDRRHWFFKPAKGHAGKAVYRGEKLSRSTWPTILASPYVAQRYVPPSRLHVEHAGASLKMDLRANAWQGQIIQLAARLYEGQTTNFRTPGGGFAPVFVPPVDMAHQLHL
ncbi:hypothetical protein CU669_18995 [Paramagnetospirillum kuznetsovii]|uniref:Circularly permuted ATPgrasp domain-containing protein n=2 Tax=Paramagnetospirillum kuznetsovii TaxID=2053833 RepID=A0A364NTH7_9PROT|nr:hypothetical protein CU669_18995 [Paramagnetospirillum kuznetsovii]